MGFFAKLRAGLKKLKDAIFGRMGTFFRSLRRVDEEALEELEEMLIMADVGATVSSQIIDELRDEMKQQGISDGEGGLKILKEILLEKLGEETPLKLDTKPSIILVIGVNGVGKTTSIAKISNFLKEQRKKVMLAAGDTFRAGAIEQLQIWADRVGVPIVHQNEGADPAAVVFDAIGSAKSKNIDVLLSIQRADCITRKT